MVNPNREATTESVVGNIACNPATDLVISGSNVGMEIPAHRVDVIGVPLRNHAEFIIVSSVFYE